MPNEQLNKLMLELDALVGAPGEEENVAEYIKRELEGYYDEFEADPLGNQFFIKKGKVPGLSVMVAAHMDEIAFIVQHIDEDGFIYFAPHGMHDDRMVVNQVLSIQTRNGPVYGITGTKPAHVLTPEDRHKVIPMSEIHIDVGTTSKEETLALGVRVGDNIVWDRTGRFLNNGKVFTGKAVDDRSGCAVLIEVMKRLKDKELDATVYGVATVQEEVGIRGAGTAGFSIQPTIALAIDVTIAGDTPGVDFKSLPIKFGKGPAIKYFDWVPQNMIGNSVPKKLTRALEAAAEAAEIPYQREVLLGGATDASAISLSGKGVVAGCISIPARYIHSAIGSVHMDDLENAINLIVALVESFHEAL